MNDDRTVVEFVQSGRARAPADQDARVLAAMAAASAATAPAAARRTRFAAAVLVGGIVVVAAVAMLRHQQQQAALQRPDAQESPAPDAPQEPAAPAPTRRVPAAELLRRAPVIAVVEVAEPAEAVGCFATVLRVVQGSVHEGQQLCLHGNAAGIDRELAFTDAIDLADPVALAAMQPAARSRAFLLALSPMDEAARQAAAPALTGRSAARAATLPWLCPVFGCGLPAMPAVRGDVPAGTDAATRLLGELDACLGDADAQVRAAGVRALGAFGDDAPWRVAARADRLLALAEDAAPEVRSAAAVSLHAAGDAGLPTLQRLLFDGCADVRVEAVRALRAWHSRRQSAPPEWLANLAVLQSWWPLFTSPRSQREWLLRCRRSAAADGADDYTGAFLRQLDKNSAANHVLGAIGLGLGDDRTVLPRLVALQDDAEGCVRAAAAWARIRLGDRDGYGLLKKQAASDDAGAAIAAIDLLRRLDGKEALDALVAATGSRLPVARALAAAGLPALRDLAPHQIATVLGDLRRDASAMVRLAAGGD